MCPELIKLRYDVEVSESNIKDERNKLDRGYKTDYCIFAVIRLRLKLIISFRHLILFYILSITLSPLD